MVWPPDGRALLISLYTTVVHNTALNGFHIISLNLQTNITAQIVYIGGRGVAIEN